MIFSAATFQCVCLPGFGSSTRNPNGVILSCAPALQVSALGPNPAGQLPKGVVATNVEGSVAYSLLEGSSMSVTLGLASGTSLANSTQVVVQVSLVVNNTASAGGINRPPRFTVSTTVVTLTAASPFSNVLVAAVQNAVVDGASLAWLRVTVDAAATTAQDYLRAPVPTVIRLQAVDDDFAGVTVTRNASLISDLPITAAGALAPVSGPAAIVRLTSAPLAPVQLVADGLLDPNVELSGLSSTLMLSADMPSAPIFVRLTAGGTSASAGLLPAGPVTIRLRTTSNDMAYNNLRFNFTVDIFRYSMLQLSVTAPATLAEGSEAGVTVSLSRPVPPGLPPVSVRASVVSATAGQRVSTVQVADMPLLLTSTDRASRSVLFMQDTFATRGESIRVCFNSSLHQVPIPSACSTPVALLDDDQPGFAPIAARTLVDGDWPTFTSSGVLRLREGALTRLSVTLSSPVQGQVQVVLVENRTVNGVMRAAMVSVQSGQGVISPSAVNVTLLVSGVRDGVIQSVSDESRTGVLVLTAFASSATSAPAGTNSGALLDSGYAVPVRMNIPFVLIDANDANLNNSLIVPVLTAAVANSVLLEGNSTVLTVSVRPAPAVGGVVRVNLKLPSSLTSSASTLTFVGVQGSAAFLQQTVTISSVADAVVGASRRSMEIGASVDQSATTALAFLGAKDAVSILTVLEKDRPSLVVSLPPGLPPSGPLAVSEGADGRTVTITLSNQPEPGSSIVVTVASAQGMCAAAALSSPPRVDTVCFAASDCPSAFPRCVLDGPATKASVSNASLVFTAHNWNTGIPVTIRAISDGVFEDAASIAAQQADPNSLIGGSLGAQRTVIVGTRATHPGRVRFTLASGPAGWLQSSPSMLDISITDADMPGVSLLSPATSAPWISENGTVPMVARFVVTSRPFAPVNVTVLSAGEGLIVQPLSLVLNPSDWSIGREMVFRVVDNKVAQGVAQVQGTSRLAYGLPITLALSSSDPAFTFTTRRVMPVLDDDEAGVRVQVEPSVPVLLKGSQGGRVATISLTSQPASTVTLSFLEAPAAGYNMSQWSTMTDPCLGWPSSNTMNLLAGASASPAGTTGSGSPDAAAPVATLTFTPNTWATPQALVLTARVNTWRHGVQSAVVAGSIVSEDSRFSRQTVSPMSVAVSDQLLQDPPSLVSARFTASYASVLLSFSAPVRTAFLSGTSFAQPVNCTFWLSVLSGTPSAARACARDGSREEAQATAAKLGAGAVCKMRDLSMEIQLGRDATLLPGDRLVVFSGRFFPITTAISPSPINAMPALRSTTGSVVVQDAVDGMEQPRLVLNNGRQIAEISSCDAFVLSASPSGTAGRPFTLTWSVTPQRDDVTLPAELYSSLAQSSASLVLTTARLPQGVTAVFTAQLVTFSGRNATASIVLTRAAIPKPSITLPAQLTVRRSSGIQFEAFARLPSCDATTVSGTASGPAMSLYWFDVTASGSQVLPQAYTSTTAIPDNEVFPLPAPGARPLHFDGRVVSIDGLDVPAGVYTFRVFVSPSSNKANWNSADVTVTVQQDALVATLAGGFQRLIRAGADLVLDASSSGEPTAALRAVQQGVTYTWACASAEGTPCPFTIPSTAATATVAGALLAANSTYVFSVTVGAPGRTSVTARQFVVVAGLATPQIFGPRFTEKSPALVNGFLPNADVTVRAQALLQGANTLVEFRYTWYTTAGVLPDALLASGSNGTLVVPTTAVTSGSLYTLCVTAESNAPLASRGRACMSFETAPAPALGTVSVVAAPSSGTPASIPQRQVSLSFARNVAGLVYTYSTAAAVTRARTALAAADIANSDLSAVDAVTLHASRSGFLTQATTLLYRGGADDTSFLTQLLPSGNLVVCAFGVSVTGQYAVSCSAVSVPTVSLPDSTAVDLLSSATRGGDTTEGLSTASFVFNALNGSSVGASSTLPARRRSLQGGAQGAPGPSAGLVSVVNTVLAVGSVGLQGSNNDVENVISTLAGISGLIGAAGTAAQKADCRTLATGLLQALNSRAMPLGSALASSLTSTLGSCGLAPQSLLTQLGTDLSNSTGSTTFSSVVGRMTVVGSTGLKRTPVTLPGLGVSIRSMDVASSTGNPVLLASVADAILPPTYVNSNRRVNNVSSAIEVQVTGVSSLSPDSRTPFVSLAYPLSSLAIPLDAGGEPSSVTLRSLEAVYAGPDGIARHDGMGLQYNSTERVLYLHAIHNSTFAVAQGSGTDIIAAATPGGAGVGASTITEGVTQQLFIRLPSQPDATVTVAVSLPSGVCYSGAAASSMAMQVNAQSNARTCSSVSDCAADTVVECRAQAATVSPSVLTFTPSTWNFDQAVSVTATEDGVYEPEAAIVPALLLLPTSTDSRYDSRGVCTSDACTAMVGHPGTTIPITVVDLNAPAVIVSALAASIAESAVGSPVSYTMRLNSQPSADVLVQVSITGASAAVSLSTATLTFTPENWQTAQSVSITPVRDNAVSGTRSVTFVHSVQSLDPWYAGLQGVPSRVLDVLDSDVAGSSVSPVWPTLVREEGAGNSGSMTVALTARPASPVTVTVTTASDNPSTLAVDSDGIVAAAFTLAPEAWAAGIPIRFTSTGNGAATGNAAVTVTVAFSSSDPVFASLPSVTRSFTVMDVDGAGLLPALTYGAALEEGGTLSYTVTLQKPPTAAVTVALSIVKSEEGSAFPVPFTLSPTTLSFDELNSAVPQTVTITSLQDTIAYPSALSFLVRHAVAAATGSGGDPAYQALAPYSVPIFVADGDQPSVAMTPSALDFTATSAATVTVTIGSSPVNAVRVQVSTGGSVGVSLSAETVELTPSNWASGVPVTVTRLNVPHAAMTVPLTASTGGAGSGDYASFPVVSSTVLVTLPEILPSPSATPTASTSPTATATGTSTGTPSFVPSTSSAPAATVTHSPARASPSNSPVPKAEVALSLSFAGVSSSAFTSASTRQAVVKGVADAAGLNVQSVVIKTVQDAVTGVVVYDMAAHTNHRVLQSVSTGVIIELLMTTGSATQASTIGTAIRNDLTAFGARVLQSVRTDDSATFGSATVSVSSPIFFDVGAAPPATQPAPSQGLGMATIIGIAVGGAAAVAVVAAVLVYRYRQAAAEEKQSRRGASGHPEKSTEDSDGTPVKNPAAAAQMPPSATSASLEKPADMVNPMSRLRPASADGAHSTRALAAPMQSAGGLLGRPGVAGRHGGTRKPGGPLSAVVPTAAHSLV